RPCLCWRWLIAIVCAVGLLIFSCLHCRLRDWLRFERWFDRIVRVFVSYQRRAFYSDWRDFTQVHSELSPRQIARTKFPSQARTRFTVNVAWFGGRLRQCCNLHVSRTLLDCIAIRRFDCVVTFVSGQLPG